MGRGAFYSGPHRGVSSTYSQSEVERMGLWNPPTMSRTRQQPISQAQFGLCFGNSKPNNWSNSIVNGYIGKHMSGIKDAVYGYRGTQGVYGGPTGIVGAPGYSNQTVSQGLVPIGRNPTQRFGRTKKSAVKRKPAAKTKSAVKRKTTVKRRTPKRS